MLKKPDEKFRLKLANMIKNQVDISDLISKYELKDLDLSNSIIKNIHRSGEDLSNINFSNSRIGYEGADNYLVNCSLNHCNFSKVYTLGRFSINRSICKHVNFQKAWFPQLTYEYTDLSTCNMNNMVLPVMKRRFFQRVTNKITQECEKEEVMNGIYEKQLDDKRII